MALKALLLRRDIERAEKALNELREKDAGFETREAELTASIAEVETDEERDAVAAELEKFDNERSEHQAAVKTAEDKIEELRTALAEIEKDQETGAPDGAPSEERSEDKMNILETMKPEERTAFVQRDDVKAYLADVRGAIREKRALTNVGLTIPEVMLGLLRENVARYSKLYSKVNVRRISGTGRQLVMGAVPEAVWTECCANLNELNLGFTDLELDCYRVGGYFAVCNANLEDSDIDLASELLTTLGQAIGLALDKAILFGGANGASKMPLGIATRLKQESQPASYPATQRAWADLHTSNVKTIANTVTGTALIAALITNSAAADGKYSAGEMTWVMNKKTYIKVLANAIATDAQGRIVAGVAQAMPIVGGEIITVEAVPDNMIVAGYFDLYTLAERAGEKFATSEHVKFLQDQTVFKGTARYDGAPAIAEAFVFIGIDGTTPAVSGISFTGDDANTVQSIALNTATAAITGTGSVQLFALTAPGSGAVTWTSSATAKATVSDNGVVTGVTAGTSVITATCNGKTATCTVTVT